MRLPRQHVSAVGASRQEPGASGNLHTNSRYGVHWWGLFDWEGRNAALFISLPVSGEPRCPKLCRRNVLSPCSCSRSAARVLGCCLVCPRHTHDVRQSRCGLARPLGQRARASSAFLFFLVLQCHCSNTGFHKQPEPPPHQHHHHLIRHIHPKKGPFRRPLWYICTPYCTMHPTRRNIFYCTPTTHTPLARPAFFFFFFLIFFDFISFNSISSFRWLAAATKLRLPSPRHRVVFGYSKRASPVITDSSTRPSASSS